MEEAKSEEALDPPPAATQERILDRKIEPRTIPTSFSSNIGRRTPSAAPRDRSGSSAPSVRAIVKWIEEEKKIADSSGSSQLLLSVSSGGAGAAAAVTESKKTKVCSSSSFRVLNNNSNDDNNNNNNNNNTGAAATLAERRRGNSAVSSSSRTITAYSSLQDGPLLSPPPAPSPPPAFTEYAIPAAQAALRNKPVFRSPDVEDYSLTLLKHRKYLNNRPLGRCLDEEEGKGEGLMTERKSIEKALAAVTDNQNRKKTTSSPQGSSSPAEREAQALGDLLKLLVLFDKQSEESGEPASKRAASAQPVKAEGVGSRDLTELNSFWGNVRAQLNAEDGEDAGNVAQALRSRHADDRGSGDRTNGTWSTPGRLNVNGDGSSSSVPEDGKPGPFDTPRAHPIPPPPDTDPPPVPQMKSPFTASPFETPPSRPAGPLSPVFAPSPLSVVAGGKAKQYKAHRVISSSENTDDPFGAPSPAAPATPARSARRWLSSPRSPLQQQPLGSLSSPSVYDPDGPFPKQPEGLASPSPGFPRLAEIPSLPALPESSPPPPPPPSQQPLRQPVSPPPRPQPLETPIPSSPTYPLSTEPIDRPKEAREKVTLSDSSFEDTPYAQYLASLRDPGPDLPDGLPLDERRSRARKDSLARLEGSSCSSMCTTSDENNNNNRNNNNNNDEISALSGASSSRLVPVSLPRGSSSPPWGLASIPGSPLGGSEHDEDRHRNGVGDGKRKVKGEEKKNSVKDVFTRLESERESEKEGDTVLVPEPLALLPRQLPELPPPPVAEHSRGRDRGVQRVQTPVGSGANGNGSIRSRAPSVRVVATTAVTTTATATAITTRQQQQQQQRQEMELPVHQLPHVPSYAPPEALSPVPLMVQVAARKTPVVVAAGEVAGAGQQEQAGVLCGGGREVEDHHQHDLRRPDGDSALGLTDALRDVDGWLGELDSGSERGDVARG